VLTGTSLLGVSAVGAAKGCGVSTLTSGSGLAAFSGAVLGTVANIFLLAISDLLPLEEWKAKNKEVDKKMAARMVVNRTMKALVWVPNMDSAD
jgi:hypothetical protein